MPDDLEARVRALEDVEAIKKLTFRYAYSVDARDWTDVADCFAEGATIDFGAVGKHVGKDEIAKFFREVIPSRVTFTLHRVLNPVIDVQGENAKGLWYFSVPATDKPTNGAMWIAGRYDNEYVKESGVWKLSSMVATFYFRTPFDQGWVKKRMS